jgi:hypothetical protein
MRTHINAVAFREGDIWVIQGIEYDIVAHADDVAKLTHAFTRAVLANIAVGKQLGKTALEGIGPAPARFREVFELAEFEIRPVHVSRHGGPSVAVRLIPAERDSELGTPLGV